jgi:hypothetical protein
MTDYYTSTSFGVDITPAEAVLLDETFGVIHDLAHGFDTGEKELARYRACSDAFRAAFPAEDDAEPFGAFRQIFPAPDCPMMPAEFTPSALGVNEASVHYAVTGDEIEPWSLAQLLRHICLSALPLQFGWANTASRGHYDAYSGGYYEVRADRVVRLAYGSEDIDQEFLVIAMQHPDEGLLFWNEADGFGDLASAGIFTQSQASDYDLPIAATQGEWMALPPRRAYAGVM